ncbi:protein STIG1 precursor [Nicotiana tabacum]|uniref:Protein STIG1 n=2 Tax=Nicotiana tabacum TaxID=4097 RepID=STIG1_TOBAC|nr:protein STIG1 precursor [Nicotiana tabacum]Q40579.1 RecName: Full=Protein STIG1; AltName: Full=Stigma-specific protein STIG1; Flags: Precursor [Nicotiana tabacum]CAA54838.1 STIG1 [Nicotiana tabacum]
MAFINLLILIILTLSSTPITTMSIPETNRRNATTNSYTDVALSARKGAFPPPRKLGEYSTNSTDYNLICKTCKRLSERNTCCFNYSCVDVSTNRFNCGSCGLVCNLGTRCCGGICVDIQKDNGNCGKCSNVCSPGQKCSFGFCDYA